MPVALPPNSARGLGLVQELRDLGAPERVGRVLAKDYVARLRVNIARRLLVETTETLETIAARLGFAEASTFSRTFKSFDGIAPGEFRRNKGAG